MKNKQKVNDSTDNSESPTKQTVKAKIFSTGDAGADEKEEEEEEEEEDNSENELVIDERPEAVSGEESSQNNSNEGKSVSVNSIFGVEDLTPDDEIYTLQCPQNYNKRDLCNKSLDLTKLKTSITSKGELFQVQVLKPDKKFITLALSKNSSGGSLVKLPLKGHIVIQKTVDVIIEGPIDEDDYKKDRVKFPDDIKVRHPLLGVDWKTHVELADAAFIKYDPYKKKHKKRKKEKNLEEDVMDSVKIKCESSESEFSSPKKKRKKYDV